MNRLLWAALLTLVLMASVTAYAQPGPRIRLLIDSAQQIQSNDYEQTMAVLGEAEKLIDADEANRQPELRIEILNIRIGSCGTFNRYGLWKKYLQEAKDLIEKSKAELGSQYGVLAKDNFQQWAEYYYYVEDYQKAASVFSTSLEDLRNGDRSRDNCLAIYSTIQYLAAIQYIEGQFNAAVNQYLSSVPYLECAFEKSRRGNYSLTYRNIGQAYLAMKDYKNSKMYFDKAVQSAEAFYAQPHSNMSKRAERMIVLNETIASYYREIHQPDSSLIIFLKIVPLLPLSEQFTGRVSFGLAEAYAAAGKVREAVEYCRRAETFYYQTLGPKSIELSSVHMLMGDLAQQSELFEEAVKFYDRSIADDVLDVGGITGDFVNSNRILSKKQLFAVLDKKASLLWNIYLNNKDAAMLEKAWDTNQRALALLDSTSREFTLNSDKVILAEQSFRAIEHGVRMAYELYTLTRKNSFFENCFSMVDKSKGIVLLENLRAVNRFAGVDPALIDQERTTRSELFQVEQDIFKEELKGKDRAKLFTLRERYAAIKDEYSAWTEKIKNQAPAYYKLKFDHHTEGTEVIRHKLLQPGEALIEFFLGDSTLTVFGLTKQKNYLAQHRLPLDFAEQVRHFHMLLSQTTTQHSIGELTDTSIAFYDLLLKDCLQELGTEVTRLIIVPDGVLGYLPFEVLQKSASASSYLLEDYSVRYAYSASYLQEQMQKGGLVASRYFAGFVSPGSQEEKSRGFLAGASKEVEEITHVFGRGYAVFNPATKSDFLEQAKNYAVLHLAMHAEVNDENPMLSQLVFASTRDRSEAESGLTAIELYNMELNAEMAVLSACNTGFGQIHRGEGILSLSRAFAYAGVPSAVITLWAVPDAATSKVMLVYYHNLRNGLPKDQALQLAKLDFRKNNPEMDQPLFWAGFILTGSSEPVPFPGTRWWVWAFIGLVLIAVIALSYRRFKNLIFKVQR